MILDQNPWKVDVFTLGEKICPKVFIGSENFWAEGITSYIKIG